MMWTSEKEKTLIAAKSPTFHNLDNQVDSTTSPGPPSNMGRITQSFNANVEHDEFKRESFPVLNKQVHSSSLTTSPLSKSVRQRKPFGEWIVLSSDEEEHEPAHLQMPMKKFKPGFDGKVFTHSDNLDSSLAESQNSHVETFYGLTLKDLKTAEAKLKDLIGQGPTVKINGQAFRVGTYQVQKKYPIDVDFIHILTGSKSVTLQNGPITVTQGVTAEPE